MNIHTPHQIIRPHKSYQSTSSKLKYFGMPHEVSIHNEVFVFHHSSKQTTKGVKLLLCEGITQREGRARQKAEEEEEETGQNTEEEEEENYMLHILV